MCSKLIKNNLKHCPKCDQWLEFDNFSKQSNRKSGLNTYCRICGEEKRKERFDSMSKEKLSEHYKHCNERKKEAYSKNRESILEKRKEIYKDSKYKDKYAFKSLNRRYGITEQKYLEMFTKQSGLCAICKKSEIDSFKKDGPIKRLSVDHDHTTGKVRGLLCGQCNHGLGNFKDNIELIEKAKLYLEKSQN